MDIQDIKKYIGFKVFLVLKNGFKYKIILSDEYVKGNTISFLDKFGTPVDFDVSEISFITFSNNGGDNESRSGN